MSEKWTPEMLATETERVLYEALEELTERTEALCMALEDQVTNWQPYIARAEHALAKARGES